MKYKFLYFLGLITISSIMVGCSDEREEVLEPVTNPILQGSLMKLITVRDDGKISLSMDASTEAKCDVWIDLNADGKRAVDGSEDVKIFNAYEEYTLPKDVKEITIHGNITYLGCASDQLTRLDITANPYLTTLNCPQNKLSDIEISKNISLQRLDCSENEIRSLNLSANLALFSLWCYNNRLESLNVSSNTNLAALDCSDNKLTTLNVAKNPFLERLLCYNNSLTSLDISKNERLNRLWIYGNRLSDSETQKISIALNEVTRGELWLSDKQVSNEMKAELSLKGWTVR
ncbi:MAG: hypothetical protein GX416_02975 [Bacteroidales bacterium]|nr:hypothetical protein [Bacteroidales bacterium]